MMKKAKLCLGITLSFLIFIAMEMYLPYHTADASNTGQINYFVIDNYKVHIDSDSNTLVIDRAYRDLYYVGSSIDCPDTLVLPNSLEYNGTEYKVTAIGDEFIVPDNVKSLVIPEGIEKIGVGFCWAGNGLETVSLPKSLTEIGQGFIGNLNTKPNLREIQIADGNTSFKMIDGALYSYDGTILYRAFFIADTFTVRKGVITIIPYCFDYSLNVKKVFIPDGVKNIGESAFSCNENLENVELPDSVETIGRDAFSYCSKLCNIHIPSSLKIIPICCFNGAGITNAEIPEGVTDIESCAFTDCPLTSITIPSTVNDISSYAFGTDEAKKNDLSPAKIKISAGNKYFKNVKGGLLSKDGTVFYKLLCSEKTYTVPKTVKKIKEGAFSGISNAKKVILQNGIKTIGKKAFNCSNITSVVIPSTVTKVDDDAFSYSKIRKFTLPNGLKTIGDNAFSCNYLSSITIPSTVKSIGYYALHQWNSRLKVVFKGKVPPSIEMQSESEFDGGTVFYAYVPKGYIKAYKKELVYFNGNVKWHISTK